MAIFTFPAPAPLNGGLLARAVATALNVAEDDIGLVVIPRDDGDVVEIVTPDGADEAAVAAAVEAHDPQVFTHVDWTLMADGVDAAMIRWRRRGSAGSSVDYDVNGAAGTTTADPNGVVELAVTSVTAGPIKVSVGSISVTLNARES